MSKEKDKTKKISTVLEMDKQCKSSARFRTGDSEETVTTNVYLLNEGWGKLGKPTKVRVTISAIE